MTDKTIGGIELEDIRKALYDLSHKTADVLSMTVKGFNSHKKKYLAEAKSLAKEIDESHVMLTSALIDELEAHKEEAEEIKYLIPIPGHLERIGDNIESIIAVSGTKITQGILLSDRAVTEINAIFENTVAIIKSTGDLILTNNDQLKKLIIEGADKVTEASDDCATLHEERLILGVCNPNSAPVFLDVLDSLKGVAYHLRKIAASA